MSLVVHSAVNNLFPAQFLNLNESIVSGLGSVQSVFQGFDFFSPTEEKKVATCEITAWIHPGHGFVQFDCGALQKTIGMYPGVANDLKAGSIKSALGSNSISSGSNSGAISSFSSANALAFSLAARANAAARGIWGNTFAFFKYKSINGGIHSVNSAASENLSSIKLKYWGDRFPANLKDDSESFKLCQSISCKYSTVTVSEEKALKIYEYAIKTPDSYHAFGGNCVDYLTRVMDKSNGDWKKKFKYTQPPSLTERIFGIAWQYFNWRIQEY